jgi:prefoldin subunit 5
MVRLIKHNKDAEKTIETDFILAHNLYARAEIPPTDKVSLWLGANVMLEYTLDEADGLLSKNLAQANKTMDQTDVELDFLK